MLGDNCMSIYFQLNSNARVTKSLPSLTSFELPEVSLKYSNPSKSLYGCLLKLIDKGANLNELIALWDSEADPIEHFFFAMEELHYHRFLSYTAKGEKGPIATLHPFAGFRWDGRAAQEGKILLSRFAYLRRDEGKFILESPLSFAKLEIFDPLGLEILMRISKPALTEEFDSQMGARAFLELLEKGNFLEQEAPSLKIWEFHDLLFHSRSRLGRHDNPSGGTFRFLGEMPPFPAIRPSENETLIPLAKADFDENAPSFSKVLEERRSCREYGEAPITVQQLGEFLYQSAGVRRIGRDRKYDTVFRTAPGGGACHPIEIYPLVAHCGGLEPGLYRYHRLEHALSLQAPFSEELQSLLKVPESMLQNGAKVQVLFIFAARFGRMLWKYQSMGYATILKDAGALMQTMYLVATAMGLAPCANGVGNSDLFARCSGLDYLVEGAVGEFIIGSKKTRADCSR